MRHIYVQEKIIICILMMHHSRKEIGHRMPFTYIYAYDPNSEIFTAFIWRFFFETLYILIYILCIYTNTFSCSPYYKYFHKTKHSIGGRGSKNIKGYCKIHVLCI